MNNRKYGFSEEYAPEETMDVKSVDLSESKKEEKCSIEVQSEKYESGKPRRITIKAIITND